MLVSRGDDDNIFSRAMREADRAMRRMREDPAFAARQRDDMLRLPPTQWDRERLEKLKNELEAGTLDLHGRATGSNTPFHFADGTLTSALREELELYRRYGLDVNEANEGGETPVHTAVKNLRAHVLLWFLEHGGNPNAQDNRGFTPMHHLALANWGDKVRQSGEDETTYSPPPHSVHIPDLLLSFGANINGRDLDGQTPLHIAAIYDNRDGAFATWLLSHGAEVNACDNSGRTPLYLAPETYQFHSNQYIVTATNPVNELLKRHGGKTR